MFRNPAGITSQRHIGDIEQPPHFEIIRFFLEILQKKFDAFLRIDSLCKGAAGSCRQEASITRGAIDIIFHFRLVQVGNPKALIHSQGGRRGKARRSDPICLFVLLDGRIHFALVGTHFTQRVIRIERVLRRARGASLLIRWRQELFQRLLFCCNRLLANLADFAWILIPASGLGKVRYV